MSWNITHQCRFQSRTGQQYCVNISKQADTGQNIVQLTGAEHPFVTQEDAKDDIFTPIRQQTGYLRILDDTGGTLIDDLLPANNTEKMVTLVNLTTGKTEWIGFLAAEVFTQPWKNDIKEVEFPLNSALACLKDISVNMGATGSNRLAMLVYGAITSLFGEGNVPFTHLVLMDDFSNICDCLLIRANFKIFYKSETIVNDNTETVIKIGSTYKKAITAMCELFGMTLRQDGTTIVFGRYDNGGNFNINVNVMEWSILAQIYNTFDFPTLISQGQIITQDILPIANFRGDNNKMTFIPGGKEAVVSLQLVDANDNNSNIYQTPQSTIKDTTIKKPLVKVATGEWKPAWDVDILTVVTIKRKIAQYVRASGGTRRINIQIDNRQDSATENFYYINKTNVQTINGYDIRVTHGEPIPWTPSDPRNYTLSQILNDGFVKNKGDHRGAWPCRWSKGNEVLHNGILLAHDVWRTGDLGNSTASYIYTIRSSENVTFSNCYININFSLFSVVFSPASVRIPPKNIGTYEFDNIAPLSNDSNCLSSLEYTIPCVIVLYNDNTTLWWNAQSGSWQSAFAQCNLSFKNGDIISNKPATLNTGGSSGYFIPVQNFTGKIEVGILDFTYTNYTYDIKVEGQYTKYQKITPIQTPVPVYPYIHLMSDMTIDLVYPQEIITSVRSSNIYRRTIVESGFSEDKEKELTFGTYNLNYSSPSLLRSYDNNGYIQDVGYTASDGTVVAERPEMHLLNRMVEYYKTMRRTMEAKIATGIDLFRSRFSYNGRKYMAIDKKHDWEREEQEVKFIEVS